MRQETPLPGPAQRSRSMIQMEYYFQLYVLTLLARDSSSDRLWDLACSIRAKPSNAGNLPNECALLLGIMPIIIFAYRRRALRGRARRDYAGMDGCAGKTGTRS